MRGVWIGTLYKLLGNVDSTRCNTKIVLEVNSNKVDLNYTDSIVPRLVDPTML
jgi:hypothetical protein